MTIQTKPKNPLDAPPVVQSILNDIMHPHYCYCVAFMQLVHNHQATRTFLDWQKLIGFSIASYHLLGHSSELFEEINDFLDAALLYNAHNPIDNVTDFAPSLGDSVTAPHQGATCPDCQLPLDEDMCCSNCAFPCITSDEFESIPVRFPAVLHRAGG